MASLKMCHIHLRCEVTFFFFDLYSRFPFCYLHPYIFFDSVQFGWSLSSTTWFQCEKHKLVRWRLFEFLFSFSAKRDLLHSTGHFLEKNPSNKQKRNFSYFYHVVNIVYNYQKQQNGLLRIDDTGTTCAFILNNDFGPWYWPWIQKSSASCVVSKMQA